MEIVSPVLKAFDCSDHDPIDQWVPKSNDDVYYSLCLHIGPPDEEGADLFYADVVTPHSIERLNLTKSKFTRQIIVDDYSWVNVIRKVQSVLDQCSGEGWAQQSLLLSKYFYWEFENYRPHSA